MCMIVSSCDLSSCDLFVIITSSLDGTGSIGSNSSGRSASPQLHEPDQRPRKKRGEEIGTNIITVLC